MELRSILLFQNPITDRTQADVDRAKALREKPWVQMSPNEKSEWLTDLKGCLNYSDLARIENNIHLISEVLELDLPTYDGNIPDVPTESYWSNLLSNVSIIREGYSNFDKTPKVPVAPINTYQKLNDIEKILEDVYTMLTSNFFYESIDQIQMGDEIGLIL